MNVELRNNPLQGVELGPAMQQCNERERIFAFAIATGIAANNAEAAKLAGYSKPGGNYKQSGYNIAHKARVIEAIEEVAAVRFRHLVPRVISAAERIIEDPDHKDHAKTVISLLSKLGYGERTQLDVNVSGAVQVNHTDQAVEDLRIMKEMGVPREKLLEFFGFSGLGRYEAMLSERQARAPKLIEARAEETVEEATDNG